MVVEVTTPDSVDPFQIIVCLYSPSRSLRSPSLLSSSRQDHKFTLSRRLDIHTILTYNNTCVSNTLWTCSSHLVYEIHHLLIFGHYRPSGPFFGILFVRRFTGTFYGWSLSSFLRRGPKSVPRFYPTPVTVTVVSGWLIVLWKWLIDLHCSQCIGRYEQFAFLTPYLFPRISEFGPCWLWYYYHRSGPQYLERVNLPENRERNLTMSLSDLDWVFPRII